MGFSYKPLKDLGDKTKTSFNAKQTKRTKRLEIEEQAGAL